MKIYFVRHGETDWNKKKIYQGHTDIPLNEKGIQQAESAADYLKDREIEAVYTSDLKRAYRTGEIIARPHNLQPVTDNRLREINFGAWEGLDYNGIYAKYKKEFDDWYKDVFNTRIPKGGSFKDVLDNLLDFLHDKSIQKYQEIVVATHGGVIKALLGHIKKSETILWEQQVSPGSITVISYHIEQDELQIEEVNLLPNSQFN